MSGYTPASAYPAAPRASYTPSSTTAMPARVAASPVAASAAAPVVRVAARPAAYKVEESVRRVFSTFDRDGSGDLDVRELSKALQALGLETDREATRGVMAKYDTDGGGKLDLEEFARLADEIRHFQKETTAAPRPSTPAAPAAAVPAGTRPSAAPAAARTTAVPAAPAAPRPPAAAPAPAAAARPSAAPAAPRPSTPAAAPRTPTASALPRTEDVISSAEIVALAASSKEEVDRLFSFYAKLQGSGVSTGTPPTLEIEEALHMLTDFGVLASARVDRAALSIPRDAARTAFAESATGKLSPPAVSDSRHGLSRSSFWEFLLRLSLSPSLDGSDASATAGNRLQALLGCFCVGQGEKNMRAGFTTLRGEAPPAEPKPKGAADAPRGEGRAAAEGGDTSGGRLSRADAAAVRAAVSARARAPPLTFTLHEVVFTPGAPTAARLAASVALGANADTGGASANTGGGAVGGLPSAKSPATATVDANRRAAEFEWRTVWNLEEEAARAVMQGCFFRSGAVSAPVRKAFELFDKDKSGDIDTRELRPALRQLGLEGVDMGATRQAMSKYDADGGGSLSVREFASLVEDIRAFQDPSYTRPPPARPALPLGITVTDAGGAGGRVLGMASIDLGPAETDLECGQAPLYPLAAASKNGPAADKNSPRVPIGHVLYSVNCGAALAPQRGVRAAFTAADTAGGGAISLSAAASALEALGLRPISGAAVGRVFAETQGRPAEAETPINLPAFAAVHATLLGEAAARATRPADTGGGSGGAAAAGGDGAVSALAGGVEAILTEKRMALRMVPGVAYGFWVGAHQSLEILEVHNTPARLLLSARDASNQTLVTHATLFDGSLYFHTPHGAPVRGGAAWTLPGPFRYELHSVRFPPGAGYPDPASAALGADTEPVRVLLRTLSRFDRSEVLLADSGHALLEATLPWAVPFTTPAAATDPGAGTHGYGHAGGAGQGYGYFDGRAQQTSGYAGAVSYPAPHVYSSSSPLPGRPNAVPPVFHIETVPGHPPLPLPSPGPPPPTAAQVDAAQRAARADADAMQRAFEQLDTRQAGRVAVAEFGRTLKALGVQVKQGVLSALATPGRDGAAGLDFDQFTACIAKLQASGAFAFFSAGAAQVLEAKAVLDRFDKDRSNSISTRELRQALNALDLRTDSVEAMQILRHFDADKSGSLDAHELASLLAQLRSHLAAPAAAPAPPPGPDGALVAAFRSFDTQGAGRISTLSLPAALMRAGVDASCRLAQEIIRDMEERQVTHIDMPGFRRVAVAIHDSVIGDGGANRGHVNSYAVNSHSVNGGAVNGGAARAYGDAFSPPRPSSSPYYTPPPGAPAAPSGSIHTSVNNSVDSPTCWSIPEPPPTAYEAYLMAAAASGAVAIPVGRAPPPAGLILAGGALPHAAQAARAALSTAEGRAEAARARTMLATDARRTTRKPHTPARNSSVHSPAGSRLATANSPHVGAHNPYGSRNTPCSPAHSPHTMSQSPYASMHSPGTRATAYEAAAYEAAYALPNTPPRH